MENQFFERPILNLPYDYPAHHWELDESGQPTQKVVDSRRSADFVTPIPKPHKQQGKVEQPSLVFDEGKGLSSEAQQYDHTAVINAVRQQVDRWRLIPDPRQWHVTAETLNSDTSRPFDKPKSGRIAVKVINPLGDEVMKVFRVAQ